MDSDPIHPFFLRHPVSAASHLLYAGWAMYAAALLSRLSRGAMRNAVACFGISLVLLYLASGLYHAIPADRPDLIRFFRLLDLSLIHVLIAGTCTPVMMRMPPRWRSAMLVLVWGVALFGVLSKWLLPLPPTRLNVTLYASAGLIALVPVIVQAKAIGREVLAWLLAGAVAYGLGATCEALGGPIVWPGVLGPHELLHLGDMAGSTMHLVAVTRLVGEPYTDPEAKSGREES